MFLRERGMASNPKMEYQVFLCIFQRNFPIYFKPKVAIAKFVWKMQKKSGIIKSGLDAMPLFLLDDLLIVFRLYHRELLNFETKGFMYFKTRFFFSFFNDLCK